MNFSKWNKVSSTSRWLAGVLFVLVLFFGIFLGYSYQKITSDEKITTFSSDIPPVVSSQAENPAADKDIPKSFLEAKYHVLGVYTSGKTTNIDRLANQVALIVVNEKNTGIGNDDLCGSIYSPPVCYFFIQPLYIYGAPDSDRYLGKLDGQGAFDPKTLKFIDPDKVEFQTANGDAGYGVTKYWELNLTTGNFTLLKTETFGD